MECLSRSKLFKTDKNKILECINGLKSQFTTDLDQENSAVTEPSRSMPKRYGRFNRAEWPNKLILSI